MVTLIAVLLLGSITPVLCLAPSSGDYSLSIHEWSQSFINHYESNINGKFTHEYHPHLLSYTSESLHELEHALQKASINVTGRIMLMGYEEQGIPHYSTDFAQAFFTDEMSRKTNAGWSAQMYNRFGLLTGFLFKDCDNTHLPIEQIDIDQIEIFDGTGTLFQQHAFGQVYEPLMMYKDLAQVAVSRGDMNLLGKVLQGFWRTLYEGSFRISGDQHVAGTQDILFSIAYIDYIKKSVAPLKKFFLGPDFTYPIETSIEHPLAVTRHAQSFVGRMAEQLAPIDDEGTAYIFCSVVDGVGKSTFLGNLAYWKKHNKDVNGDELVV